MNAADQAYNLVLPEKKAAYHLEEVKKILRDVRKINESNISTTNEDQKTILLQKAVLHIRKGITLASRDVLYYLAAADVYEALLDNSSACAHLRYALNVIGVNSDEHPFGFEQDMKYRLADLLFRRGRGWLECGNSKMAIEVLSEATSLRPSEPKAWLLMAMARIQAIGSNNNNDLSENNNEIKENDGENNNGKSFKEKGSNDQLSIVLTCLDKAIELGKAGGNGIVEDIQAYILRGKVNWSLGQQEAGNRDFRSAALIDPTHEEVVVFQNIMFSEAGNLYSDAKDYVVNGEMELAVKSLTLAIKAAPEDLRLIVMRASVLRKMGCLEDSFVDLDRAAKMYFIARFNYKDPNPNASAEEKNSALMKCMLSHPEHMREPLEVTRQRNLTSNEAALELMTLNQHMKALVILNKTIESEMALAVADDAKKLNNRRTHKSNNSNSNNDTNIKRSNDLSSYGVDVRFLINRGDCHRALGDLNKALYDFNNSLEVDPYNWELKTRISLVHYQCGVHYFNLGQYNESKHALNSAIELNPRVALYYATRGETQYQAQLFLGAYQDFKIALELDPNLSNSSILERYRQLEPSMSTLKNVSMKRDATLPFGNILNHNIPGLISSGNSNSNGGSDIFDKSLRDMVVITKKEKFNNGKDKILYASSNTQWNAQSHSNEMSGQHLISFPMVSPSSKQQRSQSTGSKTENKKRSHKNNNNKQNNKLSNKQNNHETKNEQFQNLNIDTMKSGSVECDSSKDGSKSSPISETSRKWIQFKQNAKNVEGGGASGKSYKSKAHRNDDNEMKFVWSATDRIQKEEDIKRELIKEQKLQRSPTKISKNSSILPTIVPSSQSKSDDKYGGSNSISDHSHDSSSGRQSLFSKSSSYHQTTPNSRGRGVSKDLIQFAELSNYAYMSNMSDEKAMKVGDMQYKALNSMMDHLDSPGSPKKYNL